MAHLRRRLRPGEEITVDLRPHWWYYAKVAVVLVGTVGLGVATLSTEDGTTKTVLIWISLVLILLSTLWLMVRYLRWARTSFVVTTERVVFRTGVIAVTGIEIPLDRIHTVHFRQSILERVVGSGDVVIGSGDDADEHCFTDIARPALVQREVQERMEEYERRRSAHGGDEASVAAQLERFEAMLERGTLTPEEFRRQKERLLGS